MGRAAKDAGVFFCHNSSNTLLCYLATISCAKPGCDEILWRYLFVFT